MYVTYHFYVDGIYDHTNAVSPEKLAELLAGSYTTGPAPPPTYMPAGLAGHTAHIDRQTMAAIHSIAHIPHAWGGDYDPTIRTLHGKPHFSWKTKPAQTISLVYDASSNAQPMVSGTKNSVIYIESDALLPDEMGMQFKARFSSDKKFGLIIGFATNEPDLKKELNGIEQGMALAIKKFDDDGRIQVTVKKATKSNANFDMTTQWMRMNGATGRLNGLRIPMDALRDGDEHTFRIESHKGTITFSIDGIKFGTFTYPDETYPLRKHLTGEKIDELVDYAGQYYCIQSLKNASFTDMQFDLVNLYYYRLHLDRIATDFAPDTSPAHIVLTQSAYDALAVKAPNQIYLTVG